MSKAKKVRPTETDKKAIVAMYDFKGLPTKALAKNHYSSEHYARKRLWELTKAGLIDKKYYYKAKKQGDKVHTVKQTAVYYPTAKGLNLIGVSTDPRYCVPAKDFLEVSNLVGELLVQLPDLYSRRQTLEYYGFKNFHPPMCSIDLPEPVFIYVIGTKWHNETAKVVNFIKSGIARGKHVIISKRFDKRFLLLPNCHFLFWDTAPEIIANLARDKHYYLKEFQVELKKKFPGVKFLPYEQPYLRAQIGNKILYIAEFVTGSNFLRHHLSRPIQNVCVYAMGKEKRYFSGVSLEYGSFMFYSKLEQEFYHLKYNREKKSTSIVKSKL